MRRRRFIGSLAATGVAATAGCLGGDSPTVLDPLDPDIDPDEVSFPVNGDELPGVSVPAPLHETTIATDAFVGDRETLVTFIFSRCPGPCHTMTSTLAHVQAEAVDGGFEDEVALMPVTFDPAHDTPEVLEAFCRDNGADPLADNWYALRPETPADAESVVQDAFGVFYDEVPIDESPHGDNGDHDHDHDHDGDETTFAHTNLIVIANRDGYVERGYFGQPPTAGTVIDDLLEIRDAY